MSHRERVSEMGDNFPFFSFIYTGKVRFGPLPVLLTTILILFRFLFSTILANGNQQFAFKYICFIHKAV